MKINPVYKIEEAVTNDRLRLSMQNVRFTGRHLIATDTHVMAVVPVEPEEGDTPGYISPEALKRGRKLDKKIGEVYIRANGALALSDGSTLPRPDTDNPFPRCAPLILSASRNKAYTVALDVAKLAQLAAALGTDKVRLVFDDPTRAIFVESLHDSKAYGLLMPLRLKE